MRAWKGPEDALVPLVGYLNGVIQVTESHISPTTFPVVESTAAYSPTGDGLEDHPVPMPSGVTSGDLLLMFLNVSRVTDGAPSVPSGWTVLYNANYSTGTSHNKARCYYRVADGSEGATVTVSSAVFPRMSATTYRISNYQGTPEAGSPVNGVSVNPNPPSLSPSWGSDKTLWIAINHSSAGSTVTHPTSYGGAVDGYTGVFNEFHARTATSHRELEAASEDPGVFTLGQSVDWVANTVAIRGA